MTKPIEEVFAWLNPNHPTVLAARAEIMRLRTFESRTLAEASRTSKEGIVSGQEAEKDAARLDFIIAQRVSVDAYCGRYRINGGNYRVLTDWCDSPREAIDAAILADKEQKCTVSTPNTAKKLATLLFGGDDSEEATAPISATEQEK